MSLKSTLEWKPGVLHTQIYHFSGGNKRTYNDLDLSTIKDGSFTKIWCNKWYWVCINSANVDCFESHEQVLPTNNK